MKESSIYTEEFFTNHFNEPYFSAKEIVPIIYETFNPKSVVDFGCGIGNWLKVWKEETQVEEIVGIEGPYIKEEFFKVPKEMILLKDLKEKIVLGKRFDIAISLEVAEHIPEDNASAFVSNLVRASDVVVFSAAIKGQLGTYHINEQFPEYWANIFNEFGYIPIDYLRPIIWNNTKIEYWYRQNILIFVKKECVLNYPILMPAANLTKNDFLLRIHPEQYYLKLKQIEKTSTLLGLIRYKLYPFKLLLKRIFKL